MSEQLQLTGGAALQGGPSSVCDGTGGFPSAAVNVPLSLLPSCKQYVVSSGPQLANVNSPSAPGALSIGAVTQAHTIYLRTNVPMVFSITYTGNATPQLTYVNGMVIIEVDPAHYVTAIAVQGVGQAEYLCVGNS